MALPQLQTKMIRNGSGVLYSTVHLASGTALLNQQLGFFSYATQQPIPGGTANSTIVDTNLRTAGQLPGQQAFTVKWMALQIAQLSTTKTGVSYADYHAALDNSLLFWQYGQAQIQIAPAYMIPAGGGLYGVAGTANNVPAQYNNGAGMFFHLREPVILAPLANFSIVWQFGAGSGTPSETLACKFTLGGAYEQAIEQG